jgi:hypothetical protein
VASGGISARHLNANGGLVPLRPAAHLIGDLTTSSAGENPRSVVTSMPFVGDCAIARETGLDPHTVRHDLAVLLGERISGDADGALEPGL